MSDRQLSLAGAFLLTAMLLLAACGAQATSLPGCEDAPRPIVFVHGFMGGGDNYAKTVMRFASNGYCSDYLRAFDWNTLSFDMESNVEALSDFIDRALEETGADQVDLVGHSMGGRLSHQYLSDEKRAAKVAHYAHVASFCDLEFPDSLPVLVLSSDEDTVTGACTIEGADNQDVDGADHLQMVTLPEVFAVLYRFLNDDQPPATTDVIAEDVNTLSGKVLTFGMNLPIPEAIVKVYALDADTGERMTSAPEGRFTTDETGRWEGFQANTSTFYEFEISVEGQRPLHYYRQPFLRSNPVVYLRVLPEADFLLNAVLGNIRYDDRGSNIVVFSANQALYHGRDTLILEGMDLATAEMAPPPPDPTSTIAIFIFDTDGNGQTDGGPIPIQMPELSFLSRQDDSGGREGEPDQSSEFPFLRQYDAFLDATTRRALTLTMNGATLHVPNWKADSEGFIIAVFD